MHDRVVDIEMGDVFSCSNFNLPAEMHDRVVDVVA